MKYTKKALSGLIIFSMILLLSACAKKPCKYCHLASFRQINATLPFYDSNNAKAQYVYTPSRFYRTWINSYVTADGAVTESHYYIWKGESGHWNIPFHASVGSGSNLLGPAE